MAKRWAIPQGRYDVMKIDKYFQIAKYSNHRYRHVRYKINKFLDKEYGVGGKAFHNPHKVEKKSVRF